MSATVTACECGASDWQYDAGGVTCNGCGAEREGPLQAGFMSLSALAESQRARAEKVPDWIVEKLAEWFEAQKAAELDLRDRLASTFQQNLDRADDEKWRPNDSRWLKVWELNARAMYADETFWMLENKQHIVVCPNHGIRGVEVDAQWWEPLSLRGTLDGGDGAMAWTRYCERCAKTGWIAAKVKEMDMAWKESKR